MYSCVRNIIVPLSVLTRTARIFFGLIFLIAFALKGEAQTANITVNSPSVCLGASEPIITFTASGGTPDFTFSYLIDNGVTQSSLTISTIAGASSVNLLVPTGVAGTYVYTLQSFTDNNNNTTNITGQSVTIVVNPTPMAVGLTDQILCNGAATTAVNFTGAAPGTTFSWTNDNTTIGLAAGGTGDIASFNAINTGTSPVTVNITVTPSANGCTGAPQTFIITVNPTPKLTDPTDQTVCNGTSTTAVNFTGDVIGTSFTWTNNNTLIGLAASGTGNIASFNAINAGTTPVNATITVTPSANGCPGTPQTFTITVNPTPDVTDPIDQIVCNGTSISAVNFTGDVSGVSFTWTNNNTTIGLAASGTGDIASFNAINTGTISITATITVTPSADGCPGTPQTFTITVNPTPTVTDPIDQIVCNGTSTTAVNFTGAVTGTAFTWTNNNTTIGLAASGTGNIAPFNAINAGTTPVTATITATPSADGCTGTPRTFTITVNPTATVNAVTNQTYCNGAAAPLTTLSGPVAGTTFSWTNNNTAIGLAAGGAGDIPSFTATNATTAPITATIIITPSANGCTGTTRTYTITVFPTATVNTIANRTHCNNAAATAINFTSPVTGTTFAWTSSANVGFGTSGTGNIAAYTASNAGTSPVTATVTVTPTASGCIGSPVTFTVTVNPTATVNAITNRTYCNGAAAPLTTPSGPVAGTTFAWTNDNTAIGLAASGAGDIPSFTATNATTAPITATIIITPSANGCTGTTRTYTITVFPTTTVNTIANRTHCNNTAGTAINFTSPATGTTFAWTSSANVGFGTSGSGNIAAYTASNAGTAPVTATVIVTPTANGCTGTPLAFTVTVNPTATVNAVTNQTYCNGAAAPLTTLSGPVGGTTFAWTNNNTAIGLTASGPGDIPSFTATNATTAPITATIIITPSANGCTGTTRTYTITVFPTATINTIANRTHCNNAAATAINFTSPVTGTTFAWTSSTNVGFATSGTGNISAYTASNAGTAPLTGTVTVTPTANGCTGTQQNFTVMVNPTPTVDATPVTQTICSGNSITQIDISNPNNVTGTTFSWTRTNTVNLTGIAASGTGSSITGTLTNTQATQQTTTFTITATAGSCTSTTTVTIIVNPRPTVSATNINQTVCSGTAISNIVITNPNNVSGATFTWTRDNTTNLTGIAPGGTGSPISGTLTNTTNVAQSTIFTITASTAAGCSSTTTAAITVNPSPAVSATPSTQTICSATAITQMDFTNPNNVAGTTFSWTRTNTTNLTGIAASGTGSSITGTLTNTTNVAQTTTFTITATAGSCANTTTVTVIVNPRPTVSATNTNQTICSGTAISNIVITNPNNVSGTTFSWTRDNTSNLTGIAASGSGSSITGTLTNTTNVAQTTTFTITASTAAGCSNTTTAIITVNPRPAVSASPSTQTICSGTAITRIDFTNPNNVAGTTFSWTRTNTANLTGIAASGSGSSITGTLTNNLSTQQTTTFTITATAGSCTSTTTVTVIVNPRPTVSATNTNQTVCSGTAISNIVITNPNNVGGTTLSWTRDNTTNLTGIAASGTGTPVSGTLTNTTNVAQTTTFTITASTAAGCSNTITATITVNPRPTVNATPLTQTICSGTAITQIDITNPNNVAGTTFSWTRTNTANLTGIAAGGTGSSITGTLTNTQTSQQTTTFTITATAGSCTSTTTITVVANPLPAPPANPVNGSRCGAGTVVISATSAAGTTIDWYTASTGGVLLGSGLSFTTPVITSTTTFYAAARNTTTGCTSSTRTPVTATVNTLPTVSVSSPSTICSGISTTLTASGATTYLWSPSTGLSSTTGSTVLASPTTTTTYTVTGTGGNGCTNSANVTVTVNPSPAGGTIAPAITTACVNSNSGTLTLSGNGGVIVRWESSTDGGATWTQIANTTNFLAYSNLSQTTLYRAVIESGGCTAYSANSVVSVIPAVPPTGVTASPSEICLGDSTTLSASASGYPSSWSGVEDFNSAALDNSGGWSATANGAPHNIEASADNELNTPFNLTNPKDFNGVTYNSGDPKFAIAAGAFNSTMATPVFSTIGMSSAVFSFQHAFNLNPGTTIKVEISTDGGTTYQSVPLFQAVGLANLGTPNLGFVTTNLDLSNYLGLSNLKIRFNYQGSVGSNWAIDNAALQPPPVPITYAWTLTDPAGAPSPYYLNATDQATVRGSPPAPGTYVYTVTTTYGGCPGGSANVTVIVRPTPTATIAGTTTVCQNGVAPNITFTNPQAFPVTITYNVNGGPNLTVNIPANGTSTVAAPTGIAGDFVYNLVSVTYQANPSCTNPISGSVSVTVLPTPTVTISGTASVCVNGPAPVITFTNPMALPVTVTYNINGGANTTINIAANSTATVNAQSGVAGTFTYNLVSVSYQSAPLCPTSVTGSATVTVDPIPTCSISGPVSVGAGSPGNTYTTTILPAGGTVAYLWTITGNGIISGPANEATVTVTAGAAGDYTLTSMVTRNGCATTCSITVTVFPASAILSGNAAICVGASATLSVAFNGTAPWSFIYTDGNTPITINNVNVSPYTFTVSPTATTTYSLVSMSDANGAGLVSGSATITVNPLPVCSISGNDNVCPASTNTYNAPAGMTIYNWSIGGNAIISGATNGPTVSVVAGAICGPYTLTLSITNGNGCSSTCSQTFNATDNVNPVITVSVATNPACNPTIAQIAVAFGTATVTDNCSAGLTATFTDGAEIGTGCTRSITRTWTVTDACGNTGTETQTITFTRDTAVPVITVAASTTVVCNPTAAQIASAFGTASVTDNCSTGLTATFTDGAETGTGCTRSITRTWTVNDACGNTGTQTQTITFTRDTEAPVITCSPTQSFCVINSNSYTIPPPVTTDNCSGSLNITYQISGATTRSGTGNDASGIFNLGVSTITWTVTDACGNTSICTTLVTINPRPTPIIYHN